jgi:hypothetical protein
MDMNGGMSRSSVLTQRVHNRVYRWLALISLALSIPAFAFAFSAFLRGGAHYLSGTIAAALIGIIFLGGAFCSSIAARSARIRSRVNQLPCADVTDVHLWSSAWVRWVLAVCCLVISVLFFVPAAIVYVQWRSSFGVLEFATTPPPLEYFGTSACGVAFISIAIGLLYRQHRITAWGLLLFLVVVIAFVASGLFFTRA